MKIYKLYLMAIISSFILFSCTSERTARKNNVGKHLDSRVNIGNIKINAALSTKHNGASQTASSTIHIAGRDSLSMKLTGPFGIVLGRLYATESIFIFHNVFENTIYKGTPNAENIKTVTGINLSFNDLINIIRNEKNAKSEEYRFVKEVNDGTASLYSRILDKQFAEYLIYTNKANEMIQFQRKNAENQLELNVYYKEFEESSAISFPRKINVNIPQNDASLTIRINNIEFNEAITQAMRFKIPSSARVVDLF